jgi:hypothetical protein
MAHQQFSAVLIKSFNSLKSRVSLVLKMFKQLFEEEEDCEDCDCECDDCCEEE